MEIPLIGKKVFNKFAKHLPTPRGNQKIAPLVVISCVIWVVKLGRYWSDIPAKYGNHDTIRRRFMRWSKSGIFRAVFDSFTGKLGKSSIAAIDSSFVKAHRTACSLKSDGQPRQIGLTKGGRNTKIHLIANIEQKPIDFYLSAGNASDCKEGEKLIRKNLYRIKNCWQTRLKIRTASGKCWRARKLRPVSQRNLTGKRKSPMMKAFIKSAPALRSCSDASRIGEGSPLDIVVAHIPSTRSYARP